MKKRGLILLAAAAVLAAGILFPVLRSKGAFSVGNREIYAAARCEALPDSPLRGKRILFLGSSVTAGAAAKGESFADFLEKQDGVLAVKEAVSGTTLTEPGRGSYVARLQAADRSVPFDAVVCQLSTNDAAKNRPLGEVSASFDKREFDTGTVAGALERILADVRETWGCPVLIYTGTRYGSDRYARMTELLPALREKWGIALLDLWNDPEMNAVSPEEYRLYMADGIHPTRAGYKLWWTPRFRAALTALFAARDAQKEETR